MGPLILILGILGAGGSTGVLMFRNLYYICQPNEVLIFAGGTHSTRRRSIGYRLVKGGSGLRVPLLERAMRMDLTNMIIDLRVSNAYSKGGIPLNVEGVANIKIAGEEPAIHNAIERLLGKTRQEIEAIAKETLEGNLRGVLSCLTPEQVNEDKIAFAKSLLDEAEDDLAKLGIVLDTLKIQNISDDVRYLDSIGRKQQAELQRDARIAEAKAQAESLIQTAETDKITAVRRLERDLGISTAEAERRIQDAITQRDAVVAEAEATIASELVRIQAEIPVQQERIKQVRQQLKADVVAPAEAHCKRAIAQARGNAAHIIEDGRAQADGTRSLAESWQAAGDNARDIFLLQKLDTLMKTLTATVPEISVQNVTIVDTERGGTAAKAASFMEQIRHATGIDMAGAVNRLGTPTPTLGAPVSQPEAIQPKQAHNDPSQHTFEEAIAPEWADMEDRTPPSSLKQTVQTLLDQWAYANPSDAQIEFFMQQAIAADTPLRQQLQQVVRTEGRQGLATLLHHPHLSIPVTTLETWLRD